MTVVVLLSVVAIQVLLFQFGSITFTRSLFALHFGDAPAPPADVVRGYVRGNTRFQVALGTAFAAFLICAAFGIPSNPTSRRLMVAGVSLVSSLVFVLTMLRDRRALRNLEASLPDTGLRRAALHVRDASRSRLLEMSPLAMFILTGTFVLWAARNLTAAHGTASGLESTGARMVIYLVIQGGVTALLMWLSVRFREARTAASPRFPMFRDHPDAALRLGIDLADAEIRAFNRAKLGIAALFAFAQLHLFLRAKSSGLADTAHVAQWACVSFLLLVFAFYLLRVRRLLGTRHVS